MALDFLTETPADTAAETAMREETALPPDSTPVEAKQEVEPPKETEPPKAAEPEAPKTEEKPKFVPHAAMHEERLKRQALEKEVAELRAKLQPQPEAPKEADPDSDPIAALKEIKQWQAKQVQQSEEQRQLQEFDTRIQAHERDYAVSDPEYKDKINHLWEWRSNLVRAGAAAQGDNITDAEVNDIITREIRAVAWRAMQNGKNPGEAFAEMAMVQGYKPKAATAPEPPKEPEPPAKPTAEAESVIDRISRGQRAARPTANAGGNPPATGEMSMADLANLDGAAFDRGFEKLAKTERAQRH